MTNAKLERGGLGRQWICRVRGGLGIILCLGSLSGTRLTANDEGLRLFESEVRPVLMEHCQSCHGAKKQEAGLRLDFRQGLLHGGDSGAAVVPGNPDESLLIAAVRHIGDVQMPPKQKLKDKQIESLVQWVRLGAAWPLDQSADATQLADIQRRHWAFQPIVNPVLPAVRDVGWEQTPIDRFVLAKLEAAGLASSPPADRRALIRRVTYDLTGLPPTPEQKLPHPVSIDLVQWLKQGAVWPNSEAVAVSCSVDVRGAVRHRSCDSLPTARERPYQSQQFLPIPQHWD